MIPFNHLSYHAQEETKGEPSGKNSRGIAELQSTVQKLRRRTLRIPSDPTNRLKALTMTAVPMPWTLSHENTGPAQDDAT